METKCQARRRDGSKYLSFLHKVIISLPDQTRSFVTQREHRVDRGGPGSRKPRSYERDEHENRGCCRQHQWVSRFDSKHHLLDKAAARQGGKAT